MFVKWLNGHSIILTFLAAVIDFSVEKSMTAFISLLWLLLQSTYHRLGSLSSRNLFSQRPGGQKFEIQVSAGLVSSEASFLGLEVAVFSLCLPMAFPVCVPVSKYKDQLGLILMTSFKLNYLLNVLFPNTALTCSTGEIGLQHKNVSRTRFSP